MSVAVIHDTRFRLHRTGAHPERPARLEVIEAALEGSGVPGLSREGAPVRSGPAVETRFRSVAPVPAPLEALAAVHDPGLLAHLETACRRGVPAVDPDTVLCPDSFEIARLGAGGAMRGVDELLTDRSHAALLLARPPGHHATRTRAMGFCLLNHVAIAARHAQRAHGLERILIVDWDVHHGNGTQDIFYTDPDVFYLSIHQFPLYPGTGGIHETGSGRGLGCTLNVPLPPATSPERYLENFESAVERVLQRHRPELVLLSAGFDAHRCDPLGGQLLEDHHFVRMTRFLCRATRAVSAKGVLSVLEGGYDLGSLGTTVAAHLEALAAED